MSIPLSQQYPVGTQLIASKDERSNVYSPFIGWMHQYAHVREANQGVALHETISVHRF